MLAFVIVLVIAVNVLEFRHKKFAPENEVFISVYDLNGCKKYLVSKYLVAKLAQKSKNSKTNWKQDGF